MEERQARYQVYYNHQLEGARLYQDFVIRVSWYRMGLAICQYGSQVFQRIVGETQVGVEIKHDDRSLQFPNLWIEVAERANYHRRTLVPSGIYCRDNTWLYVIGNYNTIWYIPKQRLIDAHKAERFPTGLNHARTGRGFKLLQTLATQEFAAHVEYPNAEVKMEKWTRAHAEKGRELYRLAINALDHAELPRHHESE